jgi:outer membrane protein TolC
MKKILILLFFVTATSAAQTVDYNKIILPKSAENTDLGERLVQIAWENNPSNKAVVKEKDVAKQNLRLARWQWLDNVYGMANFNEFTIDEEDDPGVINNPNYVPQYNPYLPLYNVGVRLSLGDLVSMPVRTKKAKEEMNIASENINARKLELRALVLTNYQNYVMNKELLKIQNEITEDANASFTLAERKFKDGDLSFEDYNKALKAYNEERVRKITAENAFMISKIKIEEVIGVRMEDVE